MDQFLMVIRTSRLLLCSLGILLISLLAFQACEEQPLHGKTQCSQSIHNQSALVEPGSGSESIWEKWTSIGTVIAAVCAMIATALAYASLRQADSTQQTLRADARTERMASLWGDMQQLKYLTSQQLAQLDTPQTAQIVRNNVNIMGKIGYMWNAGLIDKEIAETELGVGYISLFEQIASLDKVVELDRTGSCPATIKNSSRRQLKLTPGDNYKVDALSGVGFAIFRVGNPGGRRSRPEG